MKRNVYLWVVIVISISLLCAIFNCINSYFNRELGVFIVFMCFLVVESAFLGVYLLKAISYSEYLKAQKEMDKRVSEFIKKISNGEMDNDSPFMEFENVEKKK